MSEFLSQLRRLTPGTALKWASVIFVAALEVLVVVSVALALVEAYS